MSKQTKDQVLSQLRRHYPKAGREYKRQLITQAVELLGYHRKAGHPRLARQTQTTRRPGPATGPPR